MNFNDTIPIEPAAELSLDNVLTDIRFRNQHGFKLVDYQVTDDRKTVVLEFSPPEKSSAKGRGR